ncbi:MAG: two pore domain potassium channel family protein [Frankiales bacterium]|nr:two pore domain potassium channel family protein [Frankiales bacterium]
MPSPRRITWWVVLRLALVVSVGSSLVVLCGATAMWTLERDEPLSTVGSWGDAVWWALTTMTTVGYGDHVPVTTGGRVVAAVVMVAGVAITGAVAAIVALAVARRIAMEEEEVLAAQARTLEHDLEARLDRVEGHLVMLIEHLGQGNALPPLGPPATTG